MGLGHRGLKRARGHSTADVRGQFSAQESQVNSSVDQEEAVEALIGVLINRLRFEKCALSIWGLRGLRILDYRCLYEVCYAGGSIQKLQAALLF